MKRRTFLRAAALSTLATASMPHLLLGQRLPDAKKIPIAVQLYSVRDAANQDLAGTLAAIKKMGYDGVEFAGYYGKDPKEIRKMLDDNELKCAGTHTGLGEYRGDRFERTAEIHKVLGAKYMIVPMVAQEDMHDIERNKRLADEFNAIAEKAKPLGLFVGYHNHTFEARVIDGMTAWERFFDATVPEVVHQMDFGWFTEANADPYKMVEKYAGRSKSVHLKESGRNRPIIGEGAVDWKRVFEVCETVGGTEWYIVEDEHGPGTLERIEKCIVALREMGK